MGSVHRIHLAGINSQKQLSVGGLVTTGRRGAQFNALSQHNIHRHHLQKSQIRKIKQIKQYVLTSNLAM